MTLPFDKDVLMSVVAISGQQFILRTDKRGPDKGGLRTLAMYKREEFQDSLSFEFENSIPSCR